MKSESEDVGRYEASQGKGNCRGTLLCIMINDEGLSGNANSGVVHLCRVLVALAVLQMFLLHYCACNHGLLCLHVSFNMPILPFMMILLQQGLHVVVIRH